MLMVTGRVMIMAGSGGRWDKVGAGGGGRALERRQVTPHLISDAGGR